MEKLLIYVFILFFLLPNLNSTPDILQNVQEQIQKAKTAISEKSESLASLAKGFSSKALTNAKQEALNSMELKIMSVLNKSLKNLMLKSETAWTDIQNFVNKTDVPGLQSWIQQKIGPIANMIQPEKLMQFARKFVDSNILASNIIK